MTLRALAGGAAGLDPPERAPSSVAGARPGEGLCDPQPGGLVTCPTCGDPMIERASNDLVVAALPGPAPAPAADPLAAPAAVPRFGRAALSWAISAGAHAALGLTLGALALSRTGPASAPHPQAGERPDLADFAPARLLELELAPPAVDVQASPPPIAPDAAEPADSRPTAPPTPAAPARRRASPAPPEPSEAPPAPPSAGPVRLGATGLRSGPDLEGVGWAGGDGSGARGGRGVGGPEAGAASGPPAGAARAASDRAARPVGGRLVPSYPPELRRREIEGEVRLAVRVAADGRVEAVTVERSSGHPAFDEAAVRAAEREQWVAATRDGQPVASTRSYTVRFLLED